MQKFNVLFVVNIPLSKESIQGVFIRNQISLIEKRHQVKVITTFGNSKIRGYLSLIHYLVFHSRKYDVIHAHQSLPILLASFFVTKKSAFVGSFLSCSHHNFRFKSEWLNKYLYRFTTNRCDAVIVKNNNSVKTSSCTNTMLLPNSVNTELFNCTDPSEIKAELGLSENKLYIGFVSAGNVHRKEKRYDLFCDIISGLQQKNANVEPLIISNKTPLDMAKYYNACSALMLTSDFEGSPNCVKEALACGIPVFARDVGDVQYWINDINDCYLLSNELSENVSQLNARLSVRTESNLQIRDKFKSKSLTEEQTINKIDELYEDLLCKKK